LDISQERNVSQISPTSSRRSSGQGELILTTRGPNLESSRKTASMSSAGSGSSGSSEFAATRVTNSKNIALKPEVRKGKPLNALRHMDSDQKRKIAAILSRNK